MFALYGKLHLGPLSRFEVGAIIGRGDGGRPGSHVLSKGPCKISKYERHILEQITFWPERAWTGRGWQESESERSGQNGLLHPYGDHAKAETVKTSARCEILHRLWIFPTQRQRCAVIGYMDSRASREGQRGEREEEQKGEWR